MNDAPAVPTMNRGRETLLLCPVCGDTYVHPVQLACLPPGAAGGWLAIDAEGVHWAAGVQPVLRGVKVTLTFVCEQGHRFQYEFEFHKGETFLRQAQGARGGEIQPATIWRN